MDDDLKPGTPVALSDEGKRICGEKMKHMTGVTDGSGPQGTVWVLIDRKPKRWPFKREYLTRRSVK